MRRLLPVDYSAFLLVSYNISDRTDHQTLQNHARRVCYNVRLSDRK